jgi:hypothetical protein
MRVQAVLKASAIPVGPRFLERLFFGYEGVRGGFEDL